MPSSASTPTPAMPALSGEIVVWKRVSACRLASTPRGASLTSAATSGRTSPSWVSAGAPSTSTVVREGSLTSESVQGRSGRVTTPRSTPALVTATCPPVAVSRSPSSGTAAGSVRSGTVDSSTRSPSRAAAHVVLAVSSTGWYGISGIAAGPSAAVQE